MTNGVTGANQLWMYDEATGEGKQIATLHNQAQGIDPTGFARGFVQVENGNKLSFLIIKKFFLLLLKMKK